MTTENLTLCRNKNNVTGICEEWSCPLANTKYATVRAVDEELFLFIKEPERISTPNQVYEKVKLSKDYNEALSQIEGVLEFFDTKFVHKCKQRLTKLTQYLERLEYIKEHGRVEFMPRKRKMNRQEKLRALKLLENINFEKDVGDELMLRLESGVYGEELKDRYHRAFKEGKFGKKRRKQKYVAEFDDNSDESQNKTKKCISGNDEEARVPEGVSEILKHKTYDPKVLNTRKIYEADFEESDSAENDRPKKGRVKKDRMKW